MDSNIWWDREFDRKNRRIRDDIREAGHKVWPRVCAKVKARLGDDAEAPEIMEAAIAGTSHYLDKLGLRHNSASVEGLILHAVTYRLIARLRKQSRYLSLDDASHVSNSRPLNEWALEIERRTDLRKVLTLFSPRGCTIILLRMHGEGWGEIASYLGIARSTAQNSFWREVRQIQIQLGIIPKAQNLLRKTGTSKG